MLTLARTPKCIRAVSQMNDSIGWNFMTQEQQIKNGKSRLKFQEKRIKDQEVEIEKQREALVNLTQGQEEEDKKKHNAILKALYKPVE